ARDGHVGHHATLAPVAIHLGRGADLRQHRHGDAHVGRDVLVPLQGVDVHEHCAGGVGDIGDVDAAVGAAGHVPHDPTVGVAEGEIPAFRRLAGPLDVVE